MERMRRTDHRVVINTNMGGEVEDAYSAIHLMNHNISRATLLACNTRSGTT